MNANPAKCYPRASSDWPRRLCDRWSRKKHRIKTYTGNSHVFASLNQAVNREETDSDRLYQTNETNEREHVTFSRRKRHIHILRLCVRGGMTARPRTQHPSSQANQVALAKPKLLSVKKLEPPKVLKNPLPTMAPHLLFFYSCEHKMRFP